MKPKVISLFAGCGGSSLGYKNAGFKELLAIDFDNHAEKIFNLNFPEVTFWNTDISKITGKQILDFCNIEKGQLDILDGSPPCQGFSTAGRRNVNDSRNDLFKKNIELINEIQPKIFIIENVSGMIKGKMKGYFKEIMQEIRKLNYKTKVKLLNASNYNVPQSRQRLFFIGIREDLDKEPVFPKPSKRKIPVKEALKNCTKGLFKRINSESKTQKMINKMQQGKSLQDIGYKYGFDCMRADLNKPSPTIKKSLGTFSIGMVHPTENRTISIPELKRIASFPDNFKFIGKFEEIWARIGNAVMPKQMEAIAKTLKEEILDKINSTNPTKK